MKPTARNHAAADLSCEVCGLMPEPTKARLTLANVVSVTVYVKDLAQFRAMDDVYETFFRAGLPARSVVEVSRLPRGAVVEISVIAGR